MRKYLPPGLAALMLLITACSGAAMLKGENTGFLPGANAYPGLTPTGKRDSYFRGESMRNYLGDRAATFFQYGLATLFFADYEFKGQSLTIESFQMENKLGAAGVFYYITGQKLYGRGQKLAIGGAAMLDTSRQSRNLYFYKGRWFISLIYTGKEPVPDLTPLARYLAGEIKTGDNFRPRGFEYLNNVPGVSREYAKVTWGNALNMKFLPVSVWTVALGAGPSGQVYVSDFNDADLARTAERDFVTLMRQSGEKYRETKLEVSGQNYTLHQSQDPREGKLLFSRYKNIIVTAARCESFAAGERVIKDIIHKIRQSKGLP